MRSEQGEGCQDRVKDRSENTQFPGQGRKKRKGSPLGPEPGEPTLHFMFLDATDIGIGRIVVLKIVEYQGTAGLQHPNDLGCYLRDDDQVEH